MTHLQDRFFAPRARIDRMNVERYSMTLCFQDVIDAVHSWSGIVDLHECVRPHCDRQQTPVQPVSHSTHCDVEHPLLRHHSSKQALARLCHCAREVHIVAIAAAFGDGGSSGQRHGVAKTVLERRVVAHRMLSAKHRIP